MKQLQHVMYQHTIFGTLVRIPIHSIPILLSKIKMHVMDRIHFLKGIAIIPLMQHRLSLTLSNP